MSWLEENAVNTDFQDWSPADMSNNNILLNPDDFVEGQCKTFRIPDGVYEKEIFVVFKCNEFFAYENSCPHTGAPLDWMPDQFLNLDKTHIQCSTHHALFRVNDGFCVSGPCAGKSLKRIAINADRGANVGEINGNGNP